MWCLFYDFIKTKKKKNKQNEFPASIFKINFHWSNVHLYVHMSVLNKKVRFTFNFSFLFIWLNNSKSLTVRWYYHKKSFPEKYLQTFHTIFFSKF